MVVVPVTRRPSSDCRAQLSHASLGAAKTCVMPASVGSAGQVSGLEPSSSTSAAAVGPIKKYMEKAPSRASLLRGR